MALALQLAGAEVEVVGVFLAGVEESILSAFSFKADGRRSVGREPWTGVEGLGLLGRAAGCSCRRRQAGRARTQTTQTLCLVSVRLVLLALLVFSAIGEGRRACSGRSGRREALA